MQTDLGHDPTQSFIAKVIEWMTGHEVFDPTVYYFSRIPTIIEPMTIVGVVFGAVLIAVLASVLPALRAARLHPVHRFADISFDSATRSASRDGAPIGKITSVMDMAPAVWAMSGMEMVKVTCTIGKETPIRRTLAWDARTVEILSRTENPPLCAEDVKTVSSNGQEMITVRNILLMEVTPEDAQAAGVSKSSLARVWAKAIRRALLKVAPIQ